MCPRPNRPTPRLVSLSLSALIVVAGCEEPRNAGGSKRTVPTAPSAADNAPPPEMPTPAPSPAPTTAEKPVSHGEILGQKTQDIRQATPEQTKGTVVADTKIVSKDPITLPGNAYVTMVGRTAIGNIQHAMDLYKAANDRYPANYDEFMTEIIKANNIRLPTLPAYQEYFYDEKEHKLQVREYPDRRAIAHPGER